MAEVEFLAAHGGESTAELIDKAGSDRADSLQHHGGGHRGEVLAFIEASSSTTALALPRHSVPRCPVMYDRRAMNPHRTPHQSGRGP